MTSTTITGPDWIPAFLATLARTGVVKAGVEATGRSHGTIYFQRRHNARFAAAWEAALQPGSALASQEILMAPASARNVGWRTLFLARLAETSSVAASAAYANVPVATVYKIRRSDPGFAARWRAALYEGYEHLEMEVLAYLRGNLPGRKLDIANAIRQLAAHRRTIAEIRAEEEEDDEQAVLDSIDALIDSMRAEAALTDQSDRAEPGHDG